MRLKAVERAAGAALAELDDLIGSADATMRAASDDTVPARRAELG